MGKELMIAVDDSESSTYAVEFALDNLAPIADSIALLHVRPEVDVESFYGTSDWFAEVDRNLQDRADKLLSRMKAIVDAHKVPCKVLTLKGDPREKIVEIVKEIQPKMLIMGSHGYGMVKRAYLGSVSDYAAQHAECPVLIVKLPHSSQ